MLQKTDSRCTWLVAGRYRAKSKQLMSETEIRDVVLAKRREMLSMAAKNLQECIDGLRMTIQNLESENDCLRVENAVLRATQNGKE